MKSLQTLKGFRDFLPEQKRQRDWVQGRIVTAFQQAGFQPLETPTLEYKETILGKYGAEADKLVYQFTDNGDREVAMRYDQTVPTARVIAQYQNDIAFPFKRYQVQNVFRADKPQKGRYREFTQCDIDIYGSTSSIADAEILATAYAAYSNVGFKGFELRVNDRQVLISVLEPFVTEEVSVMSIIQSVDKLDKLSAEQVQKELTEKGLSLKQAAQALTAIQKAQPSANLQEIMGLAMKLGVPSEALVFTSSLARGLDYYTGMIFEVVVNEYSGSLGGGGRYDNLINQLSGMSIPAVGFAVGFDRTVEVAEALGLMPKTLAPAQILVTVFDEALLNDSLELTRWLREQGVSAELYPQADKLGKQFKYANRLGFSFVAVIGSEEAAQGIIMLKNMITGEQEVVTREDLVKSL